MSDTMTVRDHTKPCQHDEDVQFAPYKGAPYWLCEVCPGGKEISLTVMTDEVWVSVASDDPEFVVFALYGQVLCDPVAPAPVPTYYEVEVDGNE